MKLMLILASLAAFGWAVHETVDWMHRATAVMLDPKNAAEEVAGAPLP
jgi:hypothetical protein